MDGMLVHNSSATFYHNQGEYGVCSRNIELWESEKNTHWKVSRKLNMRERLAEYCEKHNRNLAIQGEICGEGIQKNRDMIKGHELFVFDIFDIDKYAHVVPTERYSILSELNDGQEEQIKHVPIVGMVPVFDLYQTFDDLMAFSDGESYNPKNNREGLVFKSVVPFNGQIVSFKVISNKYLLKNE